MRKLVFLLSVLVYLGHDRCIAQQPGDLDNSFGSGGKVNMHNTTWFDVAVQTDGAILVVSKIMARYKINGTLDSTFGTNGIDTIIAGPGSSSTCNAVSIQQNAKILVTGVTVQGNVKDMLLARYNPNGSLDSSFDGDGIVLTDLNAGSDDHGYELAV